MPKQLFNVIGEYTDFVGVRRAIHYRLVADSPQNAVEKASRLINRVQYSWHWLETPTVTVAKEQPEPLVKATQLSLIDHETR